MPWPCPLTPLLQDADYQQWYDEAAHPLRKQQRRPGGLEAAWAAVLGGGSACSLVQQQLPRTLLEASGSMPWDAAAAACLQLLAALLATQRQQREQQEQLLLRAFSKQLREAGGRATTRILGISGLLHLTTAWRQQCFASKAGRKLVESAFISGAACC